MSEVPCFFVCLIFADPYFVPFYPVSTICFNLLLMIFEPGCTLTSLTAYIPNADPVIISSNNLLTHIFQGGLQAQIWSLPARSVLPKKSLGLCNLSPAKFNTQPQMPFSKFIWSWAHQTWRKNKWNHDILACQAKILFRILLLFEKLVGMINSNTSVRCTNQQKYNWADKG